MRMSYAEFLKSRGAKFAGYANYVTYQERVTPFFDTVAEVEGHIEENGISHDSIRPVSNWQEAN